MTQVADPPPGFVPEADAPPRRPIPAPPAGFVPETKATASRAAAAPITPSIPPPAGFAPEPPPLPASTRLAPTLTPQVARLPADEAIAEQQAISSTGGAAGGKASVVAAGLVPGQRLAPPAPPAGYRPEVPSTEDDLVGDTAIDLTRSAAAGIAGNVPAAERTIAMGTRAAGITTPEQSQNMLDSARMLEQGAASTFPASADAQQNPDSLRTKTVAGVGNLGGKLLAGGGSALALGTEFGLEGAGNTYENHKAKALAAGFPEPEAERRAQAASALTGAIDFALGAANPFARLGKAAGGQASRRFTDTLVKSFLESEAIAGGMGASNKAIESGIAEGRAPSVGDVLGAGKESMREMAPVNALFAGAHALPGAEGRTTGGVDVSAKEKPAAARNIESAQAPDAKIPRPPPGFIPEQPKGANDAGVRNDIVEGAGGEVGPDKAESLRETSPLPPAVLAKAQAYDAKMAQSGFTIRDVTPEGYGPKETTEGQYPKTTYKDFNDPELQKLINTIQETKTQLTGKMIPEKRVALEKYLARKQREFDSVKPKLDQSADDIEQQTTPRDNLPSVPPGVVPETKAEPVALEPRAPATIPPVTEPSGAGRTPPPEQTPQRPGGNEEQSAIKKYGITTVPESAAFVTSDGRLIDSSGKKQGSSSEGRNIDHRQIAVDALPTNDKTKGIDGGAALRLYMDRTGNARISVNDNEINVDVAKPLTDQQFATVARLAKGKTINADITDSAGNVKKSGAFARISDYRAFLDKSFNQPAPESGGNAPTPPPGFVPEAKAAVPASESQPATKAPSETAVPVEASATMKPTDVPPDAAPPVTAESQPAPEPTTSARKADMARDRESLGMDVLDSPERRSWREAMDTAQAQAIPDRAMRIADEVNKTPRSLSDVETAGLVVHATKLKNEHAAAMTEIGKLTDPAEIQTRSAEVTRIEQEFDQLSKALRTSGTEKGRALAAQKLTINQNYDLVSVKNRAKVAKGKSLTPAESKNFEKLTSDLETSNKRVAELEQQMNEQIAERALKRSKGERRMEMKPARDAELSDLYAKARELLTAGCHKVT